MDLGKKIQKLRKNRSLSQEQLAEQLNVSRQAVSKWELGDSAPDIDKIILFSNVFEVSTDYLLHDEIKSDIDIPIVKENSNSFKKEHGMKTLFVLATGTIIMGLLIATQFTWSTWHLILGFIIQFVGIVAFEGLKNRYIIERKNQLTRDFYSLNVWFIVPLPTIILSRNIFGLFPVLVVYFVTCIVVSLILKRKLKIEQG